MKMSKKSLFFTLLCVLCIFVSFGLNAQALGDVNRSGRVDINDALLVAQYSAGLNPANFYSSYADVNCSNAVDINDALLVARYSAALLTAFPCSQTPTPTITRTPTQTPTPTPTAKLHAFLLLGQSNMAGYPKAQASDKVEDPRVIVLGYDECSTTGRHTDQWDVACPPLHECYQGAIGPGDWFAKTLIQRYPQSDSIALIPCAISGEKIETFLKAGGSRYTWIINRARAAQQRGGVIEGILFHQGESNNGDTSWPGKVKTLITDLRTDLGLGNVPFLAGELLYSGGCAGHNVLVNQLPSVITNCFVISASGLVVDPADTQWRLHFDHNSQVTFGQRYAQTMISALHL